MSSPRSKATDLFLEAVRDELSQGDVVSEIAFPVWEGDGSRMGPVGFGLVLSHSCDIDKSSLVVVVRIHPLVVVPAASHGNVRRRRVFSAFYMGVAPGAVSGVEMYADFRQVVTVRKRHILEHCQRLASLTDDAATVLQRSHALFIGVDR